ncbi:MAG TPA: Imm1 family immunity protein [Mycobacteriales bacterium]|nr:Imm1 family immunity protein [Mycobacteriales bacterium]
MSNGVEAYYRHEHDEQPPILRTAEDADALVDALLAESPENNTAALYHMDRPLNRAGVPDHEFHIAVVPETGTGALRYMGESDGEWGTWFSTGGTGRTGTVLHYYMGHDREFPADSEIPLELVRTAVRGFLAGNGRRPSSVNWQPHRTVTQRHNIP